MTFDEYQQQALTTAIGDFDDLMGKTICAMGIAGEAGEVVHGVLHDGGAGEVEGIGGFARLEEDIGILGSATEDGIVGAEGTLAMGTNELLVE